MRVGRSHSHMASSCTLALVECAPHSISRHAHLLSYNMLRPRKALATAPRQLSKQHSRPSTAASRAPPTLQSRQLAHSSESDLQDAARVVAPVKQRHPVDVLYSTLVSSVGTRAAAASPINPGTGASSADGAAAAASSALQDVRAHSFIHASPWARKQLLPPSADSNRSPLDLKGDALLAQAPPSPDKTETPAQQLRRREQRFGFITDAVQTQLSNCSGRMHLPDRFISDFEFLYIVRCLPVGAGLCTPLITRLMLDCNRITSVDDVPWPLSLTHISLRHNLLTSIAGARWPPHLRCLQLDSNSIQYAPAPTSSSAAAAPREKPSVTLWPLHLTVLDLGRNRLSAAAYGANSRRAVQRVFLNV